MKLRVPGSRRDLSTSPIYNVYCDESCHLRCEQNQVMVLGAVWCPLERTREIATRLREIKEQHGLPCNFEMKWGKVSPAKALFYQAMLDYFFDDDDLHFRALVLPDKSKLRHEVFDQTHDDWYYKMYFDMLKVILSPQSRYRIYLDIKDTRSSAKVTKLYEILCNNMYDFSRQVIEQVQIVRSHEIEQLQLTDLLIGAVAYANRGLDTSKAKRSLVDRIRKRSGYSLTMSTLLREDKTNIFIWQARDREALG